MCRCKSLGIIEGESIILVVSVFISSRKQISHRPCMNVATFKATLSVCLLFSINHNVRLNRQLITFLGLDLGPFCVWIQLSYDPKNSRKSLMIAYSTFISRNVRLFVYKKAYKADSILKMKVLNREIRKPFPHDLRNTRWITFISHDVYISYLREAQRVWTFFIFWFASNFLIFPQP